jgi:hypothetical protein
LFLLEGYQMWKVFLFIIVGYFAYQFLFGEESGCDKYSSRYSCDYVENKASYDVYYWRNVQNGNSEDEELIGSITSLSSCKAFATNYANFVNETWNNRSYICMLKMDGKNMEKHRL